MDIKKIFFKQTLEDTLKLYSEKIYPIDNVEINFISKESFLEDAKKDNLIQYQIQIGLYKDFDKEYPNFLVVYLRDKNPLIELFGGSYKITICDEIAKEKLKQFTKQDVRGYLMHGFAHEITHIVQDKLKGKYPDVWERCLKSVNGDAKMAHELLAEEFADMIVPKSIHKKVENILFAKVNQNIKLVREKYLKSK